MPPIRRLSVIEQTAAYLRKAVRAGRWQEGLPGVRRLAEEIGVSRDTLRAALRLLEAEGQMKGQGHGRRRQIADPNQNRRALRVGVLLHLPLQEQNAEMQRILFKLRDSIEAAGHIWIFAAKTQKDLADDPQRVARLVETTRADAWVLVAASRQIIEWFSSQSVPSIIFGGAAKDMSMAGTGIDIVPSIQAVVRHLTGLGHRRIALIATPYWWQPAPSRGLEAFLDELAVRGIAPSDYHAPKWDQSPDGLHKVLSSLFQVTPPTALLVVEPPRVLAVLHFLNQRRLKVPQDVSLMCIGQDPMFCWCQPPVAHLRYDLDLPARRVITWITAIARGTVDRSFITFPAEFEPGGSISQAK